jgi:hypothetical protein
MTKRDQIETENMLRRLTETLAAHAAEKHPSALVANKAREHAESLRRISITLQTWFTHECNGNIQRGRKDKGGAFEWDDAGKPYWFSTQDNTARWQIPDREAGALKRLGKIMARYPKLTAYIQTDPRGAALYIIRPGDVPEGATVNSYYSRGLAVYR